MITCPSCSHPTKLHGQGHIHMLSVLPMGARFEPTDQEILEHLEAKMMGDGTRLHPLINVFIPTLEVDSEIWYTHPETLPGVGIDGQIHHFFHRTSKSYTAGALKQRRVPTGVSSKGKFWWHEIGMTKSILVDGKLKGFKNTFVLYANQERQMKVEKTNWVMHQYYLGNGKEGKGGEFVILKVFYQTQTTQCEMKNNDREMESTTSSSNDQSLHEKRLLEGFSSLDQIEGGQESVSCDQDGGEDTGPAML